MHTSAMSGPSGHREKTVSLPMSCGLFRHEFRSPDRRPAAPALARDRGRSRRRNDLCNRIYGDTDMSQRRPLSRQERTIIVSGILCVVLTLVLMQLWLITATMNAWLGGDDTIVWPAALASAVCLLLNAGLLWHLFQLDR